MEVGDDGAGGAVVLGDGACGLDDLAFEWCLVLVVGVGWEGELGVPGFVFDGHEHGAVPPARVLSGYGPSCHGDWFAVAARLDLRRREYVGVEGGIT